MTARITYSILGVLLAGFLGLPAQAQDRVIVPDPATVAPITTFYQLKITIKKGDKSQLVAVFSDAGDVVCKQIITKTDADIKRRTAIEAAGKLSAADLAAVKKAFVELDFGKLTEIAPDTEPESWVTIQYSNGEQVLTYRAVWDSYGEGTERVQAFLQTVTEIVKLIIEK